MEGVSWSQLELPTEGVKPIWWRLDVRLDPDGLVRWQLDGQDYSGQQVALRTAKNVDCAIIESTLEELAVTIARSLLERCSPF